jgi:hypothetical protein
VKALPTSLLRRIAQLAGVHTYTDTEHVVWASRSLLAVCVQQPGKRTIKLPRKANVRDLYTGAEIGKGMEQFEADFADHATRVFVLE